MEIKITGEDLNKMIIEHINQMGISTHDKEVTIKLKAGRKFDNEALVHLTSKPKSVVPMTPYVEEEEPVEEEEESPKTTTSGSFFD